MTTLQGDKGEGSLLAGKPDDLQMSWQKRWGFQKGTASICFSIFSPRNYSKYQPIPHIQPTIYWSQPTDSKLQKMQNNLVVYLLDNKEILPLQAYIIQISRTCSKYMKSSQPSTRGIAKWNLRTTGTAKASGIACNLLARKRWNWFWLIRLIGHCPSPTKHFSDLRIRFQGIFPALPRSEEERAALKREFRRTGSIPTTVPAWKKDKKCDK